MRIFKFTASIKRIFSLCCSYHNYTFRHLPTKGHLQQLDYFVDMTIMAIRVLEFSNGGYKIRRIFA